MEHGQQHNNPPPPPVAVEAAAVDVRPPINQFALILLPDIVMIVLEDVATVNALVVSVVGNLITVDVHGCCGTQQLL